MAASDELAAFLGEANSGRPDLAPTFEGRPLAPGHPRPAVWPTSGFNLLLALLADGTTLFRAVAEDAAVGFGADVAGADLRLGFAPLVRALHQAEETDRSLKLRRAWGGNGEPGLVAFVGKYHRGKRGCKPAKRGTFTRLDARVVLRPLSASELAPAVAAVAAERRLRVAMRAVPGAVAEALARASGAGEGAPPPCA
jgi:hypothetical protein